MAFLTPFRSQVFTSSSPCITGMTELSWESGWPGTHGGIPLQHTSEPALHLLGHLQQMFFFYHKPIWKWSTPYILKYVVFLKNVTFCFGLLFIVLSPGGWIPFDWVGRGRGGAELRSVGTSKEKNRQSSLDTASADLCRRRVSQLLLSHANTRSSTLAISPVDPFILHLKWLRGREGGSRRYRRWMPPFDFIRGDPPSEGGEITDLQE